jgi:protocatechuate 3,4-dioxygenase beta subunit
MAIVAPNLLKLDPNAPGAPCAKTRTETEGPFPTKNPASFAIKDITGNRKGLPHTIQIYIKNTNANCLPISDYLVDIWTCDKDGYYSQYGVNQFQDKDMSNETFLRGRQTTDRDGLAAYKTIFPGWYKGRATHIHVHVYKANGQSVLVTQIAYPEGANSAVVQVNNSSAAGYTKGMSGYTYNAQDGEFSDGVTDELGVITGDLATGFTLTHTIYVAGPVVGIDENVDHESQFKLGVNRPNPFIDETVIPVTLLRPSDVTLQIFDLQGRKLYEVQKSDLEMGFHQLPINTSSLNLASGRYIYTVEIRNGNGTFKQSKTMVKK